MFRSHTWKFSEAALPIITVKYSMIQNHFGNKV